MGVPAGRNRFALCRAHQPPELAQDWSERRLPRVTEVQLRRRCGHAAELPRNAVQIQPVVERQPDHDTATALGIHPECPGSSREQPDAQRVDERAGWCGHWTETVHETFRSLVQLRLADARRELLIATESEPLVADIVAGKERGDG